MEWNRLASDRDGLEPDWHRNGKRLARWALDWRRIDRSLVLDRRRIDMRFWPDWRWIGTDWFWIGIRLGLDRHRLAIGIAELDWHTIGPGLALD